MNRRFLSAMAVYAVLAILAGFTLTGDLRLLIGDFRQNPKKFLHFKVTVF